MPLKTNKKSREKTSSKKKENKKEKDKETKKDKQDEHIQGNKKNKKEPKEETKKRDKKNGNKNLICLDNIKACIMHQNAEKVYKNNIQHVNKENHDKILEESSSFILNSCDAPSGKYSVYFTAGEYESNVLILQSSINAYKKIRKIKPHVVISSSEHESIIIFTKSLLDSDQIELTIIKPNAYGCVLSDTVLKSLKSNTCIVSITYINHELGSVNNIEKISEILHEKHIPLHSNCSYIFGKHKLDLKKTNIDAVTVSFDKIGGPIGIGALIICNDLMNGYKLGEHSTLLEKTGPYSIPGIVSSIESLKISMTNRKSKNAELLKLRNNIIDELSKSSQLLTFANFMKSDEPPLDETKKSKNKFVILGPPIDNESYYTPSILSFIIITQKNKSCDIIKQELSKKNIIIGVPDNHNIMYNDIGIPVETQKYIIRISLFDHIKKLDIDMFLKELKTLI
jgi:cysteine sulfinate desulfinase/cysteine desulfurase-like protein